MNGELKRGWHPSGCQPLRYFVSCQFQRLELGTGGHESLACLVALILLEVLDEAGSQILGLLIPLGCVSVGVAGIQDVGVHALKLCGHHEVEVGNHLCGSLVDLVVEDAVDDATRVADGDTLARTVPARVHQVGLGTALLHVAHEFLGILCGMQLQESLAEASGECGSGLSDAALSAGELGCEAGEEVVFGLLCVEDGHGRQHTEGVGAEEDDLLCSGTLALRTLDVLDVVDGVAHAGVLGNALVGEVDLAVGVNSDVLQEGVAGDGAVDVGLSLLVEVDHLSVAATLIVEHALVVPSVLVVADELTLRVGRQCGLTRTRETEEDSGVLTVLVAVGRAVH